MPERSPLDESFESLRVTQEQLEKLGWYFFPIPNEHAEGLITGPLLQRIRTEINNRGFGKVAGRAIITFSGFTTDPREIYEIPVARSYWRQLNQQLPELPSLLGVLPEMGYNGPGMHLSLLGEVDEVIDRPGAFVYDLHVLDADKLADDAIRRIRQAGRKYSLKSNVTQMVVSQFLAGASYRK